MSTFTPKAVKELETQVRELAERLIDAIAGHGRCEFMRDVADQFPVEIFLKMFGLPLEREREYRDLAKKQLSAASPDPMVAMNLLRGIADVMRDTVLDRRENPKDDIISLLWASTIDGEPMTFEMMQSFAVVCSSPASTRSSTRWASVPATSLRTPSCRTSSAETPKRSRRVEGAAPLLRLGRPDARR